MLSAIRSRSPFGVELMRKRRRRAHSRRDTPPCGPFCPARMPGIAQPPDAATNHVCTVAAPVVLSQVRELHPFAMGKRSPPSPARHAAAAQSAADSHRCRHGRRTPLRPRTADGQASPSRRCCPDLPWVPSCARSARVSRTPDGRQQRLQPAAVRGCEAAAGEQFDDPVRPIAARATGRHGPGRGPGRVSRCRRRSAAWCAHPPRRRSARAHQGRPGGPHAAA
jgi:hypothetical protein